MRPAQVIVVVLAAILVAGCSDSVRTTLAKIRAAQPGTPVSALPAIFGKSKPDYEIPVASPPPWVSEVMSEPPTGGRYFVYLLSGTRLIIVHVTSEDKVGFATWTDT